jgi:hypothetical protein
MSVGNWLRDHPNVLVKFYHGTDNFFRLLDPIFNRWGYLRSQSWILPVEDLSKRLIFDCRMCGQCILHSTGMTCPMTCPKELRNGPCGGVGQNGSCEVIPDMTCIWVEAYNRSQNMVKYRDELLCVQPPVDRNLQGSSAWINMLTKQDKNIPEGWVGVHPVFNDIGCEE